MTTCPTCAELLRANRWRNGWIREFPRDGGNASQKPAQQRTGVL